MDEDTPKTCFVIAPIGKEGSDTRIRSDQILNHIIEPAVSALGYDVLRADQISEPGIITTQIIQHIVEDQLVIADLTGRNPNVFYELAIRHAIKQPVVQIIDSSEQIPFDVAATRTIHVDHRDLDSVALTKTEIVKQIHKLEENPTDVDSPISIALELQLLRRSDDPLEKRYAEIIFMLQELRKNIEEIRYESKSVIDEEPILELERIMKSLNMKIAVDDGQEFDISKREDALLQIRRAMDVISFIRRQLGLGDRKRRISRR